MSSCVLFASSIVPLRKRAYSQCKQQRAQQPSAQARLPSRETQALGEFPSVEHASEGIRMQQFARPEKMDSPLGGIIEESMRGIFQPRRRGTG